jgi:hypothetical protein
MRPRALCNKLNELFERGLGEGVFLAIQPHLLTQHRRFETLEPAVALGMLSDFGVSISEYLDLLENNRYSAVFSDYAVVTIQCTFASERLRTHRYSYVPCPVRPELMADRSAEEALADWIRSGIAAAGIESFRSVGTYRFDFVDVTTRQDTDPHPVSHFTFASPNCRLPVRSPMGISQLFHFLFDNFYRRYRRFWQEFAPFLSCFGIEDTITADEQLLHHLNWIDEL